MTIRREIYAIALPAIVANLTTPLLSLADMAIIGHLGSDVLIAAIALGGTLFSALYWLFAFLRMGTSGMVAQAYGRSDSHEINFSFYRPLLISVTLGVIIISLSGPIGDMLVRFLADGDKAAPLARSYYNILVFGAPATLGLYVVNGFLIGTQNSRASMWLSVGINLLNIAASAILVLVIGLDVRGAAIGSLIAQWAGYLAGLIYILWHIDRVRITLADLFRLSQLKRYLSVNGDIFLRTVCLVAVTVWFTRAGASQSVTILAVNALLMQFFMLFSYFMDGFAYAGEAIVGKYVGAENGDRISLTIKSLMKTGFILALCFTALYILGGKFILSLLTSDTAIITASGSFTMWAAAVPLISYAAFVMDGVFIGFTHTRFMLIAVAIAMVVFFTVYFSIFHLLGNHGLWLAFNAYLLTRSLLSVLLSRRLPLPKKS